MYTILPLSARDCWKLQSMRITITIILQTKTVVRSAVEVMLPIPAVENAAENLRLLVQTDVIVVQTKTIAVASVAATKLRLLVQMDVIVVQTKMSAVASVAATKLKKTAVPAVASVAAIKPKKTAVPAVVNAVATRLRRLVASLKSVVANVVVRKPRRAAARRPRRAVVPAAVSAVARKPKNPKKDTKVI